MPTIRDLLDRFRPSGAPGAAIRAAVPADRAAELSAELAPVFAALADTVAEAAEIRSAAAARAQGRRREAADAAARTTARARQRADSERADAFSRASAAAVVAGEELMAQGRRTAGEVDRRVAAALPDLVVEVADAARREIDVPLSHHAAGRGEAVPPCR